MRRFPGHTLVEFLIYLVLVSLLVGVISSVVFVVLGGKRKFQAMGEVGRNSGAALERIALAIRHARAITAPVKGGSGDRLILQMPVSAASPTLFLLEDGFLKMKEGAAATTTLTSDAVIIRALAFSNVTATNTLGTIHMEMAVSSTNPAQRADYEYGRVFYSTQNLRRRL